MYWVLADQQGTVRDLIDYFGQIAWHGDYDAFGNLQTALPTGTTLWFGYTGRLFDVTTGLQNNWHRWYDPTTGRWLSEDPIGFAGGLTSLSDYVGNDPVNRSDPNGEIWGWSTGFIGGLIGAAVEIGAAAWRGERVTLGKVVGGFTQGFIVGAAVTGDVLTAAGVGALAGGAGSATRQLIDNKGVIDVNVLVGDAALGAVGSAAGHVAGKALKKVADALDKMPPPTGGLCPATAGAGAAAATADVALTEAQKKAIAQLAAGCSVLATASNPDREKDKPQPTPNEGSTNSPNGPPKPEPPKPEPPKPAPPKPEPLPANPASPKSEPSEGVLVQRKVDTVWLRLASSEVTRGACGGRRPPGFFASWAKTED